MPFTAKPLSQATVDAIARAQRGYLGVEQAAEDARLLASLVQQRHEQDVAFAEAFGQGGHTIEIGDPENSDGSCAHDYLCAYCNAPLDGSEVLQLREAVGLAHDALQSVQPFGTNPDARAESRKRLDQARDAAWRLVKAQT